MLAELRVIAAAHWKVPPLICIDDVFMFHPQSWGDPGHPLICRDWFTREQWPTVDEIRRTLPGYVWREEGYVLFGRPGWLALKMNEPCILPRVFPEGEL